jgi:ferritin-like protein
MGMGKAGVGLIKGIDVEEVVDTLDGYYCYNLVVMHFSHALRNRLEGQAAFLLGDELEENAEQSLKAARKLADRIGDLGGVVSADPTQFVERSPLEEFSLPDSNSEVGVILSFVLERIRMIIGEYGAFLERVRGRDEISHLLVLDLLKEQVARESEIEAALMT